MNRTLYNVGWRYLLRHPWQTALMVVGIALGVAVMVAIDLANSAAGRAFDLSTEAIAGRATHQVIGGPAGLSEALYASLRGRESKMRPRLSPTMFPRLHSAAGPSSFWEWIHSQRRRSGRTWYPLETKERRDEEAEEQNLASLWGWINWWPS